MFEKKIERSEMIRCTLCKDAPCTKACGIMDPAKLLLSIWFDNEKVASALMGKDCSCSNAKQDVKKPVYVRMKCLYAKS